MAMIATVDVVIPQLLLRIHPDNSILASSESKPKAIDSPLITRAACKETKVFSRSSGFTCKPFTRATDDVAHTTKLHAEMAEKFTAQFATLCLGLKRRIAARKVA